MQFFRGFLVRSIEIYISIISIAKAHSHDIDLLFFLVSWQDRNRKNYTEHWANCILSNKIWVLKNLILILHSEFLQNSNQELFYIPKVQGFNRIKRTSKNTNKVHREKVLVLSALCWKQVLWDGPVGWWEPLVRAAGGPAPSLQISIENGHTRIIFFSRLSDETYSSVFTSHV